MDFLSKMLKIDPRRRFFGSLFVELLKNLAKFGVFWMWFFFFPVFPSSWEIFKITFAKNGTIPYPPKDGAISFYGIP